MSKRGRPAANLLCIGDTDTSRPEQEPQASSGLQVNPAMAGSSEGTVSESVGVGVEQSEPVAIWQKHWRPGRAGAWEDEDEARCKTLAGQYSNEWEIRVVYTAPPEPTDRLREIEQYERDVVDSATENDRLRKALEELVAYTENILTGPIAQVIAWPADFPKGHPILKRARTALVPTEEKPRKSQDGLPWS